MSSPFERQFEEIGKAIEPISNAAKAVESQFENMRGADLSRFARGVDSTSLLQFDTSHFAEAAARKNRALDANIVAGELAKANMASEFYDRLVRMIEAFDEKLDNEHEVGVQLVSFGREVVFRVDEVGYYNPSLVTFDGRMDDGSKVSLVQHVSQISFLLKGLKRANPKTEKVPFGFTPEKVREFHELATSQGMSWCDESGCWTDKDGKRFDREGTPISDE